VATLAETHHIEHGFPALRANARHGPGHLRRQAVIGEARRLGASRVLVARMAGVLDVADKSNRKTIDLSKIIDATYRAETIRG